MLNPPEKFDTECLVFRKPRIGDAPAIFSAYAQDPEVTRYMTWRPHKNVEETYKVLELMLMLWEAGESYSYVITLKDSDSAIGMIAMHPHGYKVEIGYVLARMYWSKGYLTEAARTVTNWLLEQPEIHRVYATCDVDNPASARVMEKVGMVREGLLRKYNIHPNISDVPRDCYMYAIVKS